MNVVEGTCSCPGFLYSRFLICKHRILHSSFRVLDGPDVDGRDERLWFDLVVRHRSAPFWRLPAWAASRAAAKAEGRLEGEEAWGIWRRRCDELAPEQRDDARVLLGEVREAAKVDWMQGEFGGGWDVTDDDEEEEADDDGSVDHEEEEEGEVREGGDQEAGELRENAASNGKRGQYLLFDSTLLMTLCPHSAIRLRPNRIRR